MKHVTLLLYHVTLGGINSLTFTFHFILIIMARDKEGKDKLRMKAAIKGMNAAMKSMKAATKSIRIATKSLEEKGTSKSAKNTTEIKENVL